MLNKKDRSALPLDKSKENTVKTLLMSNEELEVKSWLKGPVREGITGTVEISPETWKDLTFTAVRNALISICFKAPTILFLDDIQWADSASLALLHYLSRTIISQRLLILAAYRSEDAIEDNNGQAHQLLQTLRLVRRENLVNEIKLSGLTLTEIRLLAENMIGCNIESSLAKILECKSQGNPLFIVESLRMLSEKQSTAIDKDRWCLSTDELGVPMKIKDIILSRVTKLKPAERKLLDVASVVGSNFDPEMLAEVVGQDRLYVLDMLDSISKTTSLVKSEGSYYKFDHAKSRDALYEEIPLALRKIYHSKIADKIETQFRNKTKTQANDLAYHYSKAQNKDQSIKYSLIAGAEALAFVLGTEAIEHFSNVLDIAKNDPKFAEERDIAMEGLGDGLFASGKSEAIQVFKDLNNQTNSNLVRIRAMRKAARASLVQGNYEEALLIVKQPIDTTADKLESTRFRLMKGMVEAWGGDAQHGLEDIMYSLNIFEKEYSLADVIDSLLELSIAYLLRDKANSTRDPQLKKAIASLFRALTICEDTNNISKQFYGTAVGFIVCQECGLPKQSENLVKESQRVMQKISDPQSRDSNEPWYYWISGYAMEGKVTEKLFLKLSNMLAVGVNEVWKIEPNQAADLEFTLEYRQELEKALEESKKGLPYAEDTDFFEIQTLLYGNIVRQSAMLGQTKQAELYLAKIEKIFNETTVSGFVVTQANYFFSKAVYLSSIHQWDEANLLFKKGIAYCHTIGLGNGVGERIHHAFARSLINEGRFREAKKEFVESKKYLDDLNEIYVSCDVMGYLIAPEKVTANKEFSVRLDLINVSETPCLLDRVDQLLPQNFKLLSIKPFLTVKDGSVQMVNRKIQPFQDQSMTLIVQATELGSFDFKPILIYTDNTKVNKIHVLEPTTITVEAGQPSIAAGHSLNNRQSEQEARPFSVFLCYKKSSGKDFADHLKTGLEELGIHTFLDSKDIPLVVEGQEGWAKVRDKALEESKFFVLVMTPGFDLSSEVVKEIGNAGTKVKKPLYFLDIAIWVGRLLLICRMRL